MITSGIVTVGTSPTALNSGDTTGGGDLEGSNVLVRNPGTATLFVGGVGVTADATPASGGYPLAQNEVMAVSCAGGEVLYAVVASGTADVNVLRTAM